MPAVPVPTDSRSRPGVLAEGFSAGTLSALALLALGRRETGSPWAPLNAVSHMLWGRRAYWRDDPSAAYTLLGTGLHAGSSMLWGGLYTLLRRRRLRPTLANAVSDAALVTAAAAVVDLKLVPARFTPGFEHRLSKGGLGLFYGSFALGLALIGARALSR
jgi:hypothetical protein